LIRLLKDQFKVATLSRGYKRRTKGYVLATEESTALEIGDEPMQFHIKFPEIPVAVGEDRLDAISQLLHDIPATEAIILDDAFQHRSITAGLNILLTDYSNLFTRDFYLPTGDLRDLKSEYKRAEIIVVTKCKPDLSVIEKQMIIEEINPQPGQSVFFASIEYSQPYHIFSHSGFSLTENTEVLLVSGIANPRPLKTLLEKHSKTYYLLQYADHRIFTIDDLKEIRKRFATIDTVNKIILTTEKDAVRLVKFKTEIADWPLYVIPVRHHFLYGEGDRFNQLIINFIRNFGQPEKN
jgi:tetraacyldisaccharide 4'-kinase